MACKGDIPCCAVLVGEEGVGLSASRRNGTFGDTVDSVLGVGVEHTQAVIVDRGAGCVSLLSSGVIRGTYPLDLMLLMTVIWSLSPQSRQCQQLWYFWAKGLLTCADGWTWELACLMLA